MCMFFILVYNYIYIYSVFVYMSNVQIIYVCKEMMHRDYVQSVIMLPWYFIFLFTSSVRSSKDSNGVFHKKFSCKQREVKLTSHCLPSLFVKKRTLLQQETCCWVCFLLFCCCLEWKGPHFFLLSFFPKESSWSACSFAGMVEQAVIDYQQMSHPRLLPITFPLQQCMGRQLDCVGAKLSIVSQGKVNPRL